MQLGDYFKEYEEIVCQEEMLWQKKSSWNWLAFDDRNTTYYHPIMTIKKQKTKVKGLHDKDES